MSVAAAAVVGLATLLGQAQAPPRGLPAADMPMKISQPFTLASVGDLILMRPANAFADDGLQAALKLVRDADVGIGNFEGSISDQRNFDGPLRGFMGTKEVAADVKAMGFDLLNRANNHVFDSDKEGMFATNALLDEAGLVHAGAGKNLDDARAARFLETPKGRIGLVGMHTPNDPSGRLVASPRLGNSGGRPGLNALQFSMTIAVSREQFDALKKVRDAIYERRAQYSNPVPIPEGAADELDLFGTRYKIGNTPGVQNYRVNQSDLSGILRSIRNGKQFSDFMIATIHTHQGNSAVQTFHFGDNPPDFLVDLAHKSIDNGADAFVGHGVHVLRGVEIYKGKPIFYGLGEFFREMDWSVPDARSYIARRADPLTTELTDADLSDTRATYKQVNYESLVAVSRYDGARLVEVRLYPTELRYVGPQSRAGIPRIAPPEIGRRILDRVAELSKPLGTTIAIENNVGIIKVGAGGSGTASIR
jgi:poly-gamma-glutamate capsule biosynthesis protein CapA/YwtB (metallophosphatase superfamily)